MTESERGDAEHRLTEPTAPSASNSASERVTGCERVMVDKAEVKPLSYVEQRGEKGAVSALAVIGLV